MSNIFKTMLIFTAILFSSQASAVLGAKPKLALPLFESGKLYSLKKLEGKVVYIDFWASWCGPCRKSFPELNELRNKMEKKGFEIIAINLDEDKSAAKQFLKAFPVDYVILSDSKNISPKGFKVKVMPSGFLLDRRGVIRYIHKGYRNGDEIELMNKVRKLLAERR